jgi:hypothetical protein
VTQLPTLADTEVVPDEDWVLMQIEAFNSDGVLERCPFYAHVSDNNNKFELAAHALNPISPSRVRTKRLS